MTFNTEIFGQQIGSTVVFQPINYYHTLRWLLYEIADFSTFFCIHVYTHIHNYTLHVINL